MPVVMKTSRFKALLDSARRGLRKPPSYIAQRLWHEVQARHERRRAPARRLAMQPASLLRQMSYSSIDAWWESIAARPFVATGSVDSDIIERLCPGETERILAAAERAVRHRVNLLGSGDIWLGAEIDWHRDYKTGIGWAPAYCRDIEYANLDQPSDVKFPWELSRMQWLIPVGQAYMLTGDDRYAMAARTIIESWIEANPYACSVNWACTMDVALRLITWTWLFSAFKASTVWADPTFRGLFLASLYQHGDFTSRHLEKSDVNGNHYTADAAGLVFAGLFFGGEGDTGGWGEKGWAILSNEIKLQVFDDGVDFEASVPYHRLVQELFLLPALYRRQAGLDVSPAYIERLRAMARFTAAYSRFDGSVPLWGDADDARTLPFRDDRINDHRYLIGIAGLAFDDAAAVAAFSGPRSEIFWLLGHEAAAALPDRPVSTGLRSTSFTDGGFYVLRSDTDHVFIDCGRLGLADRGGHGHNDLLSFEAMLDGVHLVTDCGAYLYTANYAERNNFRSTGYHNTPSIDGAEINRFIRPDYLWFLHNDAAFGVDHATFSEHYDEIVMWHSGYTRLEDPVKVVRTISLDHLSHSLRIADNFLGAGEHGVEIPLHLAPGVSFDTIDDRHILSCKSRTFELAWETDSGYQFGVTGARFSPSYGVVEPITRLHWRRQGTLQPLAVTLTPVV